jgi:hypothetical protein
MGCKQPGAISRNAPGLKRRVTTSDRFIAGVCPLFIRPVRLIRSAIALKPSMLLTLHRAFINRKCRILFSQKRRQKPGPKGPSKELLDAVVETKRRNPAWGPPANCSANLLGFCAIVKSKGQLGTSFTNEAALYWHLPPAKSMRVLTRIIHENIKQKAFACV